LSASKRYVEIKRSCNHFANCEEKWLKVLSI
jgi:hypothetical protein